MLRHRCVLLWVRVRVQEKEPSSEHVQGQVRGLETSAQAIAGAVKGDMWWLEGEAVPGTLPHSHTACAGAKAAAPGPIDPASGGDDTLRTQEASAKAARELEAKQDVAAKERARLDAVAELLKAKRLEITAQVGLWASSGLVDWIIQA